MYRNACVHSQSLRMVLSNFHIVDLCVSYSWSPTLASHGQRLLWYNVKLRLLYPTVPAFAYIRSIHEDDLMTCEKCKPLLARVFGSP